MTEPAPLRIWVLSPVFYDADSYVRLRAEILQALAGHDRWRRAQVDFVVVDDSGAVDLPTRRLGDLESTRVVSPPFNLGHQRAIVYGLRAIRGELAPDDYVVTLDADGEDQPGDVVRLLDEAADRSVERQLVVLGRRTTRNESLKFRLMYLAFKVLFRGLTGRSIATGNFAVQRGYFVINTIDHPTFDLCFSTSLLALRRPVSFVPCARGRRYAGQSRMNTFGLVAHGIRMMLPFAENLAVRLLTVSFAAFTAAVLLGLATAVATAAGHWSLVAVAVAGALAGLVGTVTFVGFLTVFAGFAQSSAIALQGLDEVRRDGSGVVARRSVVLDPLAGDGTDLPSDLAPGPALRPPRRRTVRSSGPTR